MESASLGQLILTGVPGAELDRDSAALFRRVQPGGFIIFGRNIKTAPELRKLIDDLRDLSKTEPIITIDQEGGRVSRLRLIGNEPPNAQQLREKGDIKFVRRHGEITGRLLRLFGFNLDLCPVLDISFDDEADNSLRGRCYGRSVEQVVRLAGAFNDAMREQGIASCGKHFPGYSAATIDAHHKLPLIERTRAQLDSAELAVFRHFIGRGGLPEPPAASSSTSTKPDRAIAVNRPYQNDLVDSMMICHGWYPSLEKEKTPASLSRRIVTELLRDELGFDGLVMTDDLDMGAILNEYGLEETIQRAISAGNDLAMICHRMSAIEEAVGYLEKVPAEQLDRALESIARFKSKVVAPDAFSASEFEKLDAEVLDLRVAVLGSERAAERSPEDGKRSPVEMF